MEGASHCPKVRERLSCSASEALENLSRRCRSNGSQLNEELHKVCRTAKTPGIRGPTKAQNPCWMQTSLLHFICTLIQEDQSHNFEIIYLTKPGSSPCEMSKQQLMGSAPKKMVADKTFDPSKARLHDLQASSIDLIRW